MNPNPEPGRWGRVLPTLGGLLVVVVMMLVFDVINRHDVAVAKARATAQQQQAAYTPFSSFR